MSGQELRQRHLLPDSEVWTVVQQDSAYTVHAPDEGYDFLFGTYFDREGQPLQHQVEFDGDRVQFDLN